MTKTIGQLYAEAAAIDRSIRAARVQQIRQSIDGKVLPRTIQAKVEKMESMIAQVNYDKSVLDDLIDLIEVIIGHEAE